MEDLILKCRFGFVRILAVISLSWETSVSISFMKCFEGTYWWGWLGRAGFRSFFFLGVGFILAKGNHCSDFLCFVVV